MAYWCTDLCYLLNAFCRKDNTTANGQPIKTFLKQMSRPTGNVSSNRVLRQNFFVLKERAVYFFVFDLISCCRGYS